MNIKSPLIFCSILALSSLGLDPLVAQTTAPEHGSVSITPAKRWEDAFVTGNGRMGALLFGNPTNDTLIANHCRLYLPMGNREIVPDLSKDVGTMRQIYRDKNPVMAENFLMDEAKKQGWPGLIFTDPYHPGLFVTIRQPTVGTIRDYKRTEDFRTGEVTVSWRDDLGEFRRRLFVSRTDNVIVFTQTGPAPCELKFPAIDQKLISSQQEITPGWVTYHNTYVKGKGGYDAAVRIVRSNKDCDTLLLIRIVPWKTPLPKEQSEAWAYSPENPDFKKPGVFHPVPDALADSSVVAYLKNDDSAALMPQLKQSLATLVPDYEQLLVPHAKAHAALFDRVKLDLEGGADLNKTTEELLAEANTNNALPLALMEKMYDAGRYMLLCCAGELPPNLHGIWTGSWTPQWSGDFTLDANVSCAMASACSANLPELMEGYFRMIESWYPEWRINAKRMYGCRGVLSNARASNTCLMLHWGRWHGNFWTAGSGWLASFFSDYADYTGDRQFLEQRTVPLLKECAAFYEDFLAGTEQNGQLTFIPSYNPETGPGINATMDIAVAREVFTKLIADCRTLNIEQDNIPRWEALLAKLPVYSTTKDGFLPEFAGSNGMIAKHRHHSQLYGCFQSFDPLFETNATLRSAAQATVRGKVAGSDGGGEQSSFGRVQCGISAAYLGLPEEAYGRLKVMAVKRSMNPSLITSHEPNSGIFNTDGNGGIPQIVDTMLLKKNQLGELELLQALPKEWPKGSIKSLRALGGLEVNLEWADGKLLQAQITSLIGGPLKVRYGNQCVSFDTKPGQSITLNGSLAAQ
jgi:hypothetical protein